MYTLSNGSSATQPLNSSSVRELKAAKEIRYSSECGWAIAYGFDENGNMTIAVHAHTLDDIKDQLDPKRKTKRYLDYYGFE